MRARDIHVGIIRAFFSELDEHGYSAAYINSHRTMLNSVFNYGLKTGDYHKNPVASIPQLRERERTRLLTSDEWRRLLPACHGDPELRCFIILAALTTMQSPRSFKGPGERCMEFSFQFGRS
jgi:integrase